ncbi:MAG TPA: alpha/beta hydrolase, partial [Blastocatellia bacterium]|nr:alpha/beta hydrolase [Blastocatellia bacterium]
MPTAILKESPSIPGTSPVPIHYRQHGDGPPLVYLHGGWGYEAYPFDLQITAFQDSHKILIPDRTGYGNSLKIADFPVDFHRRAAQETRLFLDALAIEKAILWGHSDGSVIAALMALEWPDRVRAVILEAFHYYRVKPGSQDFFNSMVINPYLLGDKISAVLIGDHGREHWQQVIRNNGLGWQKIAT